MAPSLPIPRILIVDPEGRSAVRLTAVLEEDGFAVEESEDFIDVMDRIAAGVVYDLIISEAETAGDPATWIRTISAADPTIGTILIERESASYRSAVQALRAGASDLIPARFSVDDLRQAVARAFARREMLLSDRRHQGRFEQAIRLREESVLTGRFEPPFDGRHPVGTATRDEQESFRRSVRAIVHSVEISDTAQIKGHGLRVERFVRTLASGSGWYDDDEIFELGIAALFHDVGKVSPGANDHPARIGDTRGSASVWGPAGLGMHPVIGGRIARAFHSPSMERAIRHHHEHFDGTGYPDRLHGDQIPFEAQLILAADSFDHMTRHSPRKPSLSTEEVVNEFVKGAGTRFHPDLVELVRSHADALDRFRTDDPDEPSVDLAEAS